MADLRSFFAYLAVWFAVDLAAWFARFGELTPLMPLVIPLCQGIALCLLFLWKDARRQRSIDVVVAVVAGNLLSLIAGFFSADSEFSRAFFVLQLVSGLLALLLMHRILTWTGEGGVTSQK